MSFPSPSIIPLPLPFHSSPSPPPPNKNRQSLNSSSGVPTYSENIIMRLVALSRSRQEAHERIRVLSHEAASVVKNQGRDNDLIERIRADTFFAPIVPELDAMLDPKTFVGMAPRQVEKFLEPRGEVATALERYAEGLSRGGERVELSV